MVAFIARGARWVGALVVLVSGAAAFAQDAGLTQRLDALCAKLEKKREEHHIPGMAIAVVKDDKVILARGFGLRDVEKNIPADEKTLFAIGSSSKAFTAALCAMMVDEGKMGWDDPVSKHFPIFSMNDAAAKEATIRDALCHRTGAARTDLLWYGGTASIEQVYGALGRAKLQHKFREAFVYNNNTFAAAGFAAAAVAGTDWDTMVATRLFTPLGMLESNTSVAKTLAAANHAKGYSWNEDDKKAVFKPMRNLRLAAPAGAINSNVLDMARWVRLQLGRGTFEGKKLISKGALEEIWTRQINIAPTVGYGMGWMIHDWNGKRVVEHGGNIDGFAAQVGLLPEEDAGYVLLMNVSASALQGESQSMVWETIVPPPANAEAGAISADKLAEYVGEYKFAVLGVDVKALVKDGKLHLDVPGQTVYELKWPDDKGKWFFAMTDTIGVSFVRDEKSQITSMTMYQGGLEMDLPRKGVKLPPAPYTDGELARFEGEYHFAHLGRTEDWKVFVRDGRLAVAVPKQFAFTLRWPDEKGVWEFQELKGMAVEFEKDASGAIVAMMGHQGGMDFHMPRKGGAAVAGAPLPTVDDLMGKRKAAGAPFSKAGALRMTGTVEMPMQGVSGTVKTVFAGTDRFLNLIDFPPFGFIHQSSDGTRVLSESLGEEFHEVKGAKRDETIRQGPGTFWADLRTMYDTVEVTGEETIDGARAIVVKGSKKDGKARTRVLVNPDNGLPLREETTMMVESIGALPITVSYSDYREQSGLLIPFKISIASDVTGGMDIVYTKAEVGVETTAETFVIEKAK